MTEKQLASFYKKTHKGLLVYVANLVNMEFAEEVLDDAYIKLFNLINKGGFKQISDDIEFDYKAFLATDIKNGCLNELKRERRADNRHKRGSESEQGGDNLLMEIEDKQVKALLYKEIKEAIEQLPTDRKKIIISWREGFSYEKIAQHYNISINTARVQLSRAFADIRRFISPEYKQQQRELQLQKEWEKRNQDFNKELARLEGKSHLRRQKVRGAHCKHGHDWIPENIYTNPTNGKESCRICMIESTKKSVLGKQALA